VFRLGSVSGSGTTDSAGVATLQMTVAGPAGVQTLSAEFGGGGAYGPSSDSRTISVSKEDTALSATSAAGTITARLAEADGAGLPGQTIVFSVEQKVRGQVQMVEIGRASTGSGGVATFDVPNKHLNGGKGTEVAVSYAGDGSFLPSSTTLTVSRR
jgi:hypothetical protein